MVTARASTEPLFFTMSARTNTCRPHGGTGVEDRGRAGLVWEGPNVAEGGESAALGATAMASFTRAPGPHVVPSSHTLSHIATPCHTLVSTPGSRTMVAYEALLLEGGGGTYTPSGVTCAHTHTRWRSQTSNTRERSRGVRQGVRRGARRDRGAR